MKPEIMAEEPRYKRRKQANPRRKNVLNFENAAAASSETDDETTVCSDGDVVDRDKDLGGPAVGVPSLEASPRMGHALLSLKAAEGLRSLHQHWRLEDNMDDTNAHRRSSGDKKEGFGGADPESVRNTSVRMLATADLDDYFLKRGAEEGEDQPVSIAEYLQRSDTAIIYPEAPEEQSRLGTPELLGLEESEHELQSHTPDDFAQLLTCPYCDRGYKRLSSLREHIKYRHEKNEESFSCPLCSEAFSSRTQLERHMTTHKASKEQLPLLNQAGNRKFKCSECGKAFKYKHHLKEHLRIHSGEKPYECSNCKKRFSHSGSYSSHISSKKCISLAAVNGRVRSLKPGSSPSSMTSSPEIPVPSQFCHKLENGHSLGPADHQGQLEVKPEPLNLGEYCHMMSSRAFAGPDVYLNGHGGSPLSIFGSSPGPQQQLGGFGVDLSQLGYAGHLGNLNEVQKVLEVVENPMSRQKRDRNPKEVSKLRAYMKELETQMEEQKPAQTGFHKGYPGDHAKIISECLLEKVHEAKDWIPESRRVMDIKEEKLPTELSSEEKTTEHLSPFPCFSCQYCKETFSGPIPLHQHERYLCKMNEEIKAVLQPAEEPEERPDLSIQEGTTSTIKSLKDESVLKTCFDVTAEPTAEDLHKISVAVGLPEDFISDWFSQWKRQTHQGGRLRTKWDPSAARLTKNHHRLSTGARAAEQEVQVRSSTSSPLNLSSTPVSNSWSCSYTSEDARGDSPLDLSLPKRDHEGHAGQQEEPPGPSESISIKKEVLAPENLLRQPERSTSPTFSINPLHLYASLPHEAFPAGTFMSPGRATIPGFRPYAALDPISLLPHMAYSYAAGATFTHMQHRSSYQRRASVQGELLDGKLDYLSGLDDLTDSESLACRKKMKKTESGTYACDLCDKTFQKTSSLLRHKYEHTGRRPHQCQTCQKAFKHKHHLIEHARLHSGEKPYQCDKCGKRFSHSGSYSQHMNHRYSYCKREAEEREEARRGASGEVGEGLEPRGLLGRRTYLHELEPLGFSGPEEQQEDGGGSCTVLRVSSLESKMDVDRKLEEDLKDRQTRRIGEEEEKQEEECSGWT